MHARTSTSANEFGIPMNGLLWGSWKVGSMKRNSRNRLRELRLCMGEKAAWPESAENSARPIPYSWQFCNARNGNAPGNSAMSIQGGAKKVLGKDNHTGNLLGVWLTTRPWCPDAR